jgi:hypothetical protein
LGRYPYLKIVGGLLNDSADRDIRLNEVELCMFARFAHKMHVFLRVFQNSL